MQKWNDEDLELWSSRLDSWISQYGESKVRHCAEYLIDNYSGGPMTIAAFKAELMQSVRMDGREDGPVSVCGLCHNDKWIAVTPSDPHSRHTRCPCPPSKRETWTRKRGLLIPAGETMESMRDNYLEFWQMFKELARKSVRAVKGEK